MFTGIVRGIGTIVALRDGSAGRRLSVDTAGMATGDWRVGDSVAVSGVCLTVVAIADHRFEADLSAETLRCTTLGRLVAGSAVNLEPAARLDTALGGHLVTGHVDGVGIVRRVTPDAGSRRVSVEFPAGLGRYVAVKGSITLDGVSLTVGAVSDTAFEEHLVPHTCAVTTLAALAPGQAVNLEVDLVARYLDRLLDMRGER
jgi:riboflavin synthase